jgi:hypothetical protein
MLPELLAMIVAVVGLCAPRWLTCGVKVTVDMVNVLYEFGQQQFSIGNYVTASDLLYQFRILVS